MDTSLFIFFLIIVFSEQIYLGWSDDIDSRPESVLVLKVLGSIFPGVNLSGLINAF
jgi:hypothetical protein